VTDPAAPTDMEHRLAAADAAARHPEPIEVFRGTRVTHRY
jgi:hypothetical protein